MRKNWVELISHPALMWEGVRTLWAFRSRSGILPPRALIDWRIATAYGTSSAEIATDDLVSFLQWRRRLRRLALGRTA